MGEGSTKKKSPVASEIGFEHGCVGVGVLGKGTQSLAVRPKTAWFLFFLLAFVSNLFPVVAVHFRVFLDDNYLNSYHYALI